MAKAHDWYGTHSDVQECVGCRLLRRRLHGRGSGRTHTRGRRWTYRWSGDQPWSPSTKGSKRCVG